ncbi:MAG: ribokinase, partial [Inquilinus sp.]|nr:ribokinase [Inquilinus sp.]
MIVVFGSLNMDLVLRVPAIPRPGETVLCPDYATHAGGKGNNQAIAAAKAGAAVAMAGSVGHDGFGDTLLENLRAHQVDTAGIGRSDRPTGIAMICVDSGGENAIAVASGANLVAGADL